MIRFIQLESDQRNEWSEAFLKELPTLSSIYAINPSADLIASLDRLGVTYQSLTEGTAPDDSVILLPAPRPLYRLLDVVDRLLGPGGCPWDQEQTHESLKRHLIEESYEVLDAIDSGSLDKLKEELGDLLMQPFMHAQMEKLEGRFDIDEVATLIVEKLIRRHPHVFGDREVHNSDEVLSNWDQIKQTEKGGEPESLLAGVPKGMAALLRAFEISKRAARVGFEWPNIEAVYDKLREEEAEFHEALASGDKDHIEAELGDILFTVVNIARWTKIEPEEALRKMLNRFTERFMQMEKNATKPLKELTMQEWDELWEISKANQS